MAPKGDFENRDRDETSALGNIPLSGSLADLPKGLSLERGELDTFSARFGSQVPDIVSGEYSRESAARTGLGSPVSDFTVRSVYDVRPPSAKDFNLGFTTVSTEVDPDTFEGFQNLGVVPQGYVAVVRGVTIYLPPTPVIAASDGQVRFFVNGTVVDPEVVAVGGAVGISLPSQTAGIPFRDGSFIETYFIADEGSMLGAALTFVTPPALAVEVVLRGNFLLKTGVPAMFQPANLAGKASHAVTSSDSDIDGPKSLGPSGADLVMKRRRRVPFANVPILRKG